MEVAATSFRISSSLCRAHSEYLVHLSFSFTKISLTLRVPYLSQTHSPWTCLMLAVFRIILLRCCFCPDKLDRFATKYQRMFIQWTGPSHLCQSNTKLETWSFGCLIYLSCLTLNLTLSRISCKIQKVCVHACVWCAIECVGEYELREWESVCMIVKRVR